MTVAKPRIAIKSDKDQWSSITLNPLMSAQYSSSHQEKAKDGREGNKCFLGHRSKDAEHRKHKTNAR